MTTTTVRDITITTSDYERLRAVLAANGTISSGSPWQMHLLERELNRATLVAPHEVSSHVVTMNSKVRVRGGHRSESDTWTIVYPDEADLDAGRISVLSPMGLAVLGYQAGDEVTWEVPAGPRRFTIEEVVYQPEAAGHFDL